MSDVIITALIGFSGTVIVACISYAGNRRGAREASETNAKLIAYRLQELEAKQNKHNGMIERMYKLEGRMDEAEHDIRDLKGARAR